MDIDKYLRNNLCDADYAEASVQLEADWQAAYRAGAEAMRERAAKVGGTIYTRPIAGTTEDYSEGKEMAIHQFQHAIRALPLDPEGGK